MIAKAPTRRASSTDPATWGSLDDALDAVDNGKADGIGITLGPGARIVAADFDQCIDANGIIEPRVRDWIAQANSYTERSPSGAGIRILAWADSLPPGRRKKGHFEMYNEGRYVTLTGHHLPGTPTDLEERTEVFATLHADIFGSPATEEQPEHAFDDNLGGLSDAEVFGNGLDDDEIIALAKGAKNGDKFRALWAGDFSKYPSHSEADSALCYLLAFWTQKNAAQIDRLFRRSGLMRDKWDSLRGDQTYGASTIAKAIEQTTEVYHTPTPTKDTPSRLIIHRASDVADEKLDTVFDGRLIRGSNALMSGPGEAGKGMQMSDTIARFTTGDPFPGDTERRDPANVLICVVEDSMGRVKSRLRAAGADLDHAFFVQGPEVSRGGLVMPSPMMLDDDARDLVRYSKKIGASALFLETLVEHFGDREGKRRQRSTNNEADVRSALSPFRAVCEAGNMYGLANIHPRKSMEGGVEDSISGSAAFRNVTRAAHHVYRDPSDESDNPVRLFFTSKANYLSRRPPTLRFRIVSWNEATQAPCTCGINNCGHEGRVVWEEGDHLVDKRTADDIWQQIREGKKVRSDVAVEEAEAFLHGLMKDGVIELPAKTIFKLASDEGISKATLKRAKDRMGLISKKEGFPASVVAWQSGVEL